MVWYDNLHAGMSDKFMINSCRRHKMFLSRIAIEALYKFAKIPKKNTVSDSEGRGAYRKAQNDQTKWYDNVHAGMSDKFMIDSC